MHFDPADRPDALYRTLSSLVVPRPIGWISTVDPDGGDNLAPFSYFNAVSSDPPTVMFSASDRDGRPKDTPRNALATGEFVCNLVTGDVLEAMDETSRDPDGSEFDATGLERGPAETVDAPRVAAAAAHLECEVVESVRIGQNTVVFGEVGWFHVDESLLAADAGVDPTAVTTVARCGGPHYSRVDLLDFQRQY